MTGAAENPRVGPLARVRGRLVRSSSHRLWIGAIGLVGAVLLGALGSYFDLALAIAALGGLALASTWLLVLARRDAAARQRSLQRRADRVEEAVRHISRAQAQLVEEGPVGNDELPPGDVDGVQVGGTSLAVENARTQTRVAEQIDELLVAVRGQVPPPILDAESSTTKEEVALIEASGLFDHEWYRSHHSGAGDAPVEHHVRRAPSADPHPLFASTWYLRRTPDAPGRWRTPLAHYLEEGWRQGLAPHPLFDAAGFEKQVGPGTRPALLRYLESDSEADPNPIFDRRWYREVYSALLRPGEDPLMHYVRDGAARDLATAPWFDPAEHRRRVLGCRPTDDAATDFLERERAGLLPPATLIARLVGDASEHVRCDEAELRWDHLASGAYRWPDTFVLTRILGNDLPPRHREGQTLDNLRFILDHEEALPGCEKRWVVNRIVDPVQEAAILSLLEERDQPYIHRPFEMDDYGRLGWAWDGLAGTPVSYRRTRQEARERIVRLDRIYGHKTRYLIDINGARNDALADGRVRGTWVLPWDGGCFVTRRAWDELRETVSDNRHLRYFTVPTARVLDNRRLSWPDFEPPTNAEPMIVFRRDASERFDESRAYGRHDKIALLIRLGVPGPWDGRRWPDDPVPGSSPQAGQFQWSSWVARLAPGRAELETSTAARRRHRSLAVRALVDELDAQVLRPGFDPGAPLLRSASLLARQRERWRTHDPVVAPVVASLLDRSRRDVAIAEIEEGERPAEFVVAALAAWFAEDEQAAARADGLLESIPWLDEKPGRRDLSLALPVTLDGVRLLALAGCLSAEQAERIRDFAAARAERLDEGDDAARLRRSADRRGTWYDVERLALAVHQQDVGAALATLRRAQERLLEQFDDDGEPQTAPRNEDPTETEGVLSNLQAWTLLCRLSASVGAPLWEVTVDGRSVRRALSWAAQRPEDGWPAGPLTLPARQRLTVLLATAPGVRTNDSTWPVEPPPEGVPDVPPVEWGVPPYWRLG
jgi:hypothetical protein